MRKTIAALLLCAFLVGPCLTAFAEGEAVDIPNITNSRYVILYEESTDTVMYTKASDRGNAPASMTKVMTALLVLEYDPDLSGETVVPPEAVSEQYCYWMDPVHLWAGEEITVWDLMNYLLIHSGNEAGTTLAAYVAGDIPTFIGMMNAKAKELGMEHTHYEDPHGLSEENRITCEDMLILCREAMKNPLFRQIVSTPDGALPISNKRNTPYRYTNTNRVMCPRNVSEYDGGFSQDIIGIKTGYIRVAGQNLACCMEYDGMTFYSVVMNAQSKTINGESRSGHYMDTVELLTWARTFHRQGYAAGEQVTLTATKGSKEDNLPLAAQEDLYILTQEDLTPEITLREDLGRKVSAGEVVGTVSFTDAFGNVRETSLVAMTDAATNMTVYYVGAVVAAIVIIAGLAVVIAKHKQGKAA